MDNMDKTLASSKSIWTTYIGHPNASDKVNADFI